MRGPTTSTLRRLSHTHSNSLGTKVIRSATPFRCRCHLPRSTPRHTRWSSSVIHPNCAFAIGVYTAPPTACRPCLPRVTPCSGPIIIRPTLHKGSFGLAAARSIAVPYRPYRRPIHHLTPPRTTTARRQRLRQICSPIASHPLYPPLARESGCPTPPSIIDHNSLHV